MGKQTKRRSSWIREEEKEKEKKKEEKGRNELDSEKERNKKGVPLISKIYGNQTIGLRRSKN